MPSESPDPQRIALGIRQPWAELILRGIKTLEVRTTDTAVRGTIYLYASKQLSSLPAAAEVATAHGLELDRLPRGVLVGTADLVGSRPTSAADVEPSCVPAELLSGRFGWSFANPQRLESPLVPRFIPYGIWFYPFRRRA